MNIRSIFFCSLGLMAVLLSTAVSASSFRVYDAGSIPVESYVIDTIAANPAVIRTSKISPGTSLSFLITQPDGQQFRLNSISDDTGVAYAKLSDYYTRTAGLYAVVALIDDPRYMGRQSKFSVLPGSLSLNNSEVLPKDQVIHFGSENASLTVKLRDEYSNAIPGHIVKLISSSENDKISYLDNTNISDKNGELHFQMNPGIAGLANYSVYDLTADQVLTNRSKVVYFDSNSQVFGKNKGVKLASFASNEGNSSGPVDHFEFEDIPSAINTDQSISIKVSAYDATKQVVSAYVGTLRFSVDGGNAGFVTLPNDYTFTLQDQGSHVFSLSFNFKQPGVYTLKATDLSNKAVFGTKNINVISSGSNPVPLADKSSIIILNPVPGVYSSNLQVVSGTASSGAKLKIFDSNIELSSVVADSSGKFSYTTGLLADGAHKLYVASVNDIGTVIATSSTVDFTINTKSAKISQIVVDPSGPVDPGTKISVKVNSEDSLSKAQVVVAGNVYDLIKGSSGNYEATFSAPIDFGEYKLSFKFTSELGSESKSEDKILKVGNIGTVKNFKPEVVTGLSVVPADGRVILSWSAPSSLANPIKNYRVYFGASPNQLSNAADTFTNATTWFIPNLKNGTQYYFTVAAVDMKGNISDGFDKILPATPSGFTNNVLPPAVQNGSAGVDQLKFMNGEASNTGPDVFWLLFISLFGGFFYTFGRRKYFK